MSLASELGLDVYGCDISPSMVKACHERGLNNVYHVDDMPLGVKYDIILFSHVIEHVSEESIQSFMERYLRMLRNGGYIVVLSPLMCKAFYTDIDHVKPYDVSAILALFSKAKSSRSYYSEFELELTDLDFRKEPIYPYYVRSRYKAVGFLERLVFAMQSRLASLLYYASAGIIARTTGYTATFRVV